MAPIGQTLLTLPFIQLALASYFTNVRDTHICNAEWDGHARFHVAEGGNYLICLELITLYYTWRSLSQKTVAEKTESLFTAALTGSVFCVTGLMTPYFPGILCEAQDVPAGEPGMGGVAGFLVYAVPLVVNWVGYAIATNTAKREGAIALKTT